MTAWWQDTIRQPSSSVQDDALAHQNQLTKPPGSLGQLEELAVRLASHQNTLFPSIDNVQISVFAGDHGVVEEGVSAFPQAVTVEMIKNFCVGGAAISVLAKAQDADLEVVNTGAALPVVDHPLLINKPIATGTQNFCKQAAMTDQQFEQAMLLGKESAERAKEGKAQLYIAGEMGIGNTTSAAAVASALLDTEPDALVGLGTGVDETGLTRKKQAVRTALEMHEILKGDGIAALKAVGGFELVAIAGAYIRCAQLGMTILVDGFICSAAALAAVYINPELRAWLVFAHQSQERGHQQILQALEAQPILDLGMRLGEASGAATALPLLKLACSLHNTMATFESAGVSNSE
jgi:nicotinate-nucleotide--dimethylbenzimidazole phosphoribosyltransferase